MKVHFWGVRGSIPASADSLQLRKKLLYVVKEAQAKQFKSSESVEDWLDSELPFWVTHNYGVNTPCVQIEAPGEDFIFCDAGSGLRDFAAQYMTTERARRPATFHFFISHLHWDHIQGFPFFTPSFEKHNRIVVHGYHPETEHALRTQMAEPYFPVDFNEIQAKIEFDIRPPEASFDIGNVKVTGIEQEHPGVSYGYRFEKDGKSVVYSSDAEHRANLDSADYPFIKFFENADLLIFDGQYSFAETVSRKEHWGHSSNIIGIELAARAHVKHLILFHLDSTLSDEQLDLFLANTRKYKELYGQADPQIISLACDGMVIDV